MCFAVGFANGLVTWLLLIFRDVKVDNVYVAAIAFALSGIPGNICVIALFLYIRPKTLMIAALLGTAACCAAIFYVADYGELPPALAATVVCLFNSVSTACFNVLVTVWAVPFPSELQSFAIGFLSCWMRVGAIVGQVVDATLVRLHESGSMILISGAVLAIAAFVFCGFRTEQRAT